MGKDSGFTMMEPCKEAAITCVELCAFLSPSPGLKETRACFRLDPLELNIDMEDPYNSCEDQWFLQFLA